MIIIKNTFKIAAIFLFTLISFVPTIKSQEDIAEIKYGQTISNEITSETFELQYKFQGKADEVVIIRMKGGLGDELSSPEFLVFSGKKKIIDTSKLISIFTAIAAIQLPKDGEYIIIATRRDGKSGKEVGKFALSLIKPPTLEEGKAVNDSVDDEIADYYAIDASGPFSLSFKRTNGEFTPTVSVKSIEEDGDMRTVAQIAGKILASGVMDVVPERGVAYILEVGGGLLSGFGNAQYSVTLTSAKK
jgi:hypothetical protein